MGQTTKTIASVFAGLVFLICALLAYRVSRPPVGTGLPKAPERADDAADVRQEPIIVRRPVGYAPMAPLDGDNPALDASSVRRPAPHPYQADQTNDGLAPPRR